MTRARDPSTVPRVGDRVEATLTVQRSMEGQRVGVVCDLRPVLLTQGAMVNASEPSATRMTAERHFPSVAVECRTAGCRC